MTVHRIPTRPGVASFRLRVQLDGSEYVLDFRWSQRESRWYLDLRDVAGAPLVLGLKLVRGASLLYRFRSIEGVPPGELRIVDARADELGDPGLDDLGDVADLVYLDRAELDALEEELGLSDASATDASATGAGGGGDGIPPPVDG